MRSTRGGAHWETYNAVSQAHGGSAWFAKTGKIAFEGEQHFRCF